MFRNRVIVWFFTDDSTSLPTYICVEIHTNVSRQLLSPTGYTQHFRPLLRKPNHRDAAFQRGDVVYVHCWGGRGRTGTVVCC